MRRFLSSIAIALTILPAIADETLIYPESYETDTRKMLESWYMRNYTATDDNYRVMPDVDTDDATIKKRLSELQTVVELPFNSIVRSYIDRYTKRGRAQVAAILGHGIYYFPIFEQALEAEQLPLELKYLPVIESGLDPNAVSRHGATGLWQFMIGTAKGVGLDVTSLVDERREPYASSRHAARYLHDLYDTYGDWGLAIAAYNCGPGAVNKAIRRAGGDPKQQDFWSIYEYLSPETRGYYPMFIAANYVMNYYPKHNISPVLPTRPLVTDTISVSQRVHFEQISKLLNIPMEELRSLNPQFRADVIPGTSERPYTLILPSQQALAYAMSEADIVAYEAEKYLPRLVAEPVDPNAPAEIVDIQGEDGDILLAAHEEQPEEAEPSSEGSASEPAPAPAASTAPAAPSNFSAKTRAVTHTVVAGETLGDIAARYAVTVADIRSWNSLRRNAVRAGQKLRINTTVADASSADTTAAAPARKAAPAKQSASASKSQSKSSSVKKKTQPKATTHTIKSGENLTTIAKKYGVTVDELRKANGISGDNIRAGKQLKVPSKSSSKSRSGKKSKKRRR